MASLTPLEVIGRPAPQNIQQGVENAVSSFETAMETLFLLPRSYYTIELAKKNVIAAAIDVLMASQMARGQKISKLTTFIATSLVNSNMLGAEYENNFEQVRATAARAIRAYALSRKLVEKGSKTAVVDLLDNILKAIVPLSAMIAVHREERKHATLESDLEDIREEAVLIASETLDDTSQVLDADTAAFYQAEKEDHFATDSLKEIAATMQSLATTIHSELDCQAIQGKKNVSAAREAIKASKGSIDKILQTVVEEGTPQIHKARQLATAYFQKMQTVRTRLMLDFPAAAHIIHLEAIAMQLRAQKIDLLWQGTKGAFKTWHNINKEAKDLKGKLEILKSIQAENDRAIKAEADAFPGEKEKVKQAILEAESTYKKIQHIREEQTKVIKLISVSNNIKK